MAIFDDLWPGRVINSMVSDAFRWLVEGFKTVSGGVLGVDDEEKTVYIYIYIYNTVSVPRPSALMNKISIQSTSP